MIFVIKKNNLLNNLRLIRGNLEETDVLKA